MIRAAALAALLLAVPAGVTAQEIVIEYGNPPCDTACRAMFAGEQQRKVALWHDAAFFAGIAVYIASAWIDARQTDEYAIHGPLGEGNPIARTFTDAGSAAWFGAKGAVTLGISGVLSYAYVKERSNPNATGRKMLVGTALAAAVAQTYVTDRNTRTSGEALRDATGGTEQ